MSKEDRKEYGKAWYAANKESQKAKKKAWYAANKESEKAKAKAYRLEHKEKAKAYRLEHKEKAKAYMKAYTKADVNSLGQTKKSIRNKSLHILKKMHLNIPGYEIHHCFGYEDPSKFIYISKELHLKIHQYLRDNSIDADSNHYEQIKHLLNENVSIFGI